MQTYELVNKRLRMLTIDKIIKDHDESSQEYRILKNEYEELERIVKEEYNSNQ